MTDPGAKSAPVPPVPIAPGTPPAEASSVPADPPPVYPGESLSPAGQTAATAGPGRRPVAALVGLLALVLIGAVVAILLTSGGGPPIVGPDEGRVGDELAFAVFDAEVEQWQVGTNVSTDEILILEPQSAGRVNITATTTDGTSDLVVDIAAQGPLRILGPGLLPMGQITTLTPAGADGSVTWTVGSARSSDETLQLSPTQPGTTTVVLETSGGQRVERTFTVPSPG